ncbi:hypothetical protein BH10PSE6_BH10PSE6_08480 [soil metagenome]
MGSISPPNVSPEGGGTETRPGPQIARPYRTKRRGLRRMLGRAALAIAGLFAPAALADDREPSSWKVTNLFSPCAGDCTIALIAGKSIALTPATSIFLLNYKPPGQWKWDDSYIVTLSTSRTLVQYGKYFSIDPEIGVGRYHGNAYGGEAWLAFYLRWRYFPWNDYVRTSVGVGMGPSVASNISAGPGGIRTTSGVGVANFFSPELELALPNQPGIGLVVRFHHRSYMWGILPNTGADAQFWSAGLRVHF